MLLKFINKLIKGRNKKCVKFYSVEKIFTMVNGFYGFNWFNPEAYEVIGNFVVG